MDYNAYGLAKKHTSICRNRRHKQQGGGWVEVGQGGEMGTAVIVSTLKIKLKKFSSHVNM